MAGAQGLSLGHALALGLLQGPTELLPVSSSAHTTLVPWLASWPYGELDPRLRKSFEVALHAGTAAALLVGARSTECGGGPGGGEACSSGPGKVGPGNSGALAATPRSVGAKLGFIAAAVVPPVLAGYTLGGLIERRLGTPATIAVGLLAGSVAMTASECRTGDARPVESASARDGLALGLAQALALVPGVSRSGATLAAARSRGFSRRDADRLSWRVGLPVIAGAAALQGSRLAREGVPGAMGLPLATGAASAFASTLAGARVLGRERRAALLPACAVYRAALALLVVRRMRNSTNLHAPQIPKK
jgi:undecaprenyl-diphosphatase